jgi:hypothetical protein
LMEIGTKVSSYFHYRCNSIDFTIVFCSWIMVILL